MVGGEQVRNEELQQKHSQRKKLADQRKEHLIRALTVDGEESEHVLLGVYNSIQEEVYAKSQMLLKVQGKVSALSNELYQGTTVDPFQFLKILRRAKHLF